MANPVAAPTVRGDRGPERTPAPALTQAAVRPLTPPSTAVSRKTLVVGSVAVAAVRLWGSWWARAPVIVADEPSYLSMARLLGGRGGWDLGRAATYGPAYSLLIAPWSALGLSPGSTYRAAILTNVVVAVGGYLVLERLVRRLADLARPWSAVVALVGTATPGLVVSASYAWSDTLAVLAFLLLVLAAVAVAESSTPPRVAGVVAAAVFADAVHGRFAPGALVVVAALVVLARSRPEARRALVAGAAGLGVGLVAVGLASGAIYGRLYAPGGQVRQTTGELGRLVRVGALALAAAGQVWYLLVTTAGLAGVGMVALALRSRPRPDRPGTSPVAAHRITAALVAVTVLTSIGFMTDRTRPDQLLYGRYNDAVVGLLVALGLARLSALPVRQRLAAGLGAVAAIGATGLLVGLVSAEALRGPYNGSSIRSLLAFGSVGPRRVLAVTVMGGVVAAVVTLVALLGRRRAAVLPLAVLALATFGTMRGVRPTRRARPNDAQAATALQRLVPAGVTVTYASGGRRPHLAFYLYPFQAPGLRLRLVGGDAWAARPRWAMAPSGERPPPGYRLMWTDPVLHERLWRAIS